MDGYPGTTAGLRPASPAVGWRSAGARAGRVDPKINILPEPTDEASMNTVGLGEATDQRQGAQQYPVAASQTYYVVPREKFAEWGRGFVDPGRQRHRRLKIQFDPMEC